LSLDPTALDLPAGHEQMIDDCRCTGLMPDPGRRRRRPETPIRDGFV
jgi:hypothetical protein